MGTPTTADDRSAPLDRAEVETIRTELETLARRLSHLSGQLDRLAAHQDHRLQIADHRLDRRIALVTDQTRQLDDRLRQLDDRLRQLDDQGRQHSAHLAELLRMQRDLTGPLETVRLLADAQHRLHIPFTLTGFCAAIRRLERRLKEPKPRPQAAGGTGDRSAEGEAATSAGGGDGADDSAPSQMALSPPEPPPPAGPNPLAPFPEGKGGDVPPLQLQLERGPGGEVRPVGDQGDRDRAVGQAEPEIRVHCNHPPLDLVARVGNVLRIDGWAVATAGVRRVTAVIDDGPAHEILDRQPRPDIADSFPDLPGAANSGFRGYLDLRALPAGRHRLRLVVADSAGAEQQVEGAFELDHGFTETSAPVPDLDAQYQVWLQHHALTSDRLQGLAGAASRLIYRPTFSLLMPVYNTPAEFLRLAIQSVIAQVYPEWELCIIENGSTEPHARPVLEELARLDSRIRIGYFEENQGIAGATNAALDMASGEFVASFDSDDELWPNALYECAKLLNERPNTDLIYSDEDKVTVNGRHCLPFFKPDWSPDLLTSMMYICHFSVFRRTLALAVGGFRAEFTGSQDYDLALRFTEQTDRVEHIPTILYSWRMIPGSAATGDMAKPYAVDAARRALEAAAVRRGLPPAVEPTFEAGRWRFRYPVPDGAPVTLVLLTGGRIPLLRACLDSLRRQTSYRSFDLLVVDNSEGDAVSELVAALQCEDARVRYLARRDKPFNYSAIMNHAVEQVTTPYLALVNDDVTVATPDWLEAMLEHAQRPEVGVVGAKLLYPDGSVQHAGVVTGICEISGHAFRHYPPGHHGHVDQIDTVRNTSAVTFACVLVRRAVYDEVGGLDAEHLPVAFNDVDFCLRARRLGYRIVYTPHAVLYHHEVATRTVFTAPGETTFFKEVWADALRHDPFYNPNFTRDREDYSLAVPGLEP